MQDTTPQTPTRNPWDRLDDETDKAFAAFCIYRDLGPSARSLRVVSDEVYGSIPAAKRQRASGQINKWSSQHRWVERAKAWDAEQDRLAQEAFLRENLERRRQIAKDAATIQRKALEAIESGSFTPFHGALAWDKAVKIESTARGMSSEITEQRITGQGGGPVEFTPPDPEAHYSRMLEILATLPLPPTHTDPREADDDDDATS